MNTPILIQIIDLTGNIRGNLTPDQFRNANGFTGQCSLADYVKRFNGLSSEAQASIILK